MPAAGGPFTPVQHHDWELIPNPSDTPTANNGSRLYDAKVRVMVALTAPAAATPSTLPTGFQGLADACTLDTMHDGVIALRLTVRNDGPVPLAIELSFDVTDTRRSGDGGDPIPVDFGTVFGNAGATCQPTADANATVRFASVAAGASAVQPYVVVLHNLYSPSYDSRGNVFGLRHLLAYIAGASAQVAGDDQGAHVLLTMADCYSGTPHQAAVGPGSSIQPDFALADGQFAYYMPSATELYPGEPITDPTGTGDYTACQ